MLINFLDILKKAVGHIAKPRIHGSSEYGVVCVPWAGSYHICRLVSGCVSVVADRAGRRRVKVTQSFAIRHLPFSSGDFYGGADNKLVTSFASDSKKGRGN